MKVDGLEYAWSTVPGYKSTPVGAGVRRGTNMNMNGSKATQNQDDDDVVYASRTLTADEYAIGDGYVSVSARSSSKHSGGGVRGGGGRIVVAGNSSVDVSWSHGATVTATQKSVHTTVVPVMDEYAVHAENEDFHTNTVPRVGRGVQSTGVQADDEDVEYEDVRTDTVPAVGGGRIVTTTNSIYDLTHNTRADTNFFVVEGPRVRQATIQRRPPARIGTPFVFTVQGTGLVGNSVQMHMKLVRKDAFGGTYVWCFVCFCVESESESEFCVRLFNLSLSLSRSSVCVCSI
jgi:hypothetical protein